jgi:hypothetical protein
MDNMLLKIYQREIYTQSNYALMSIQYINDILNNLHKQNATNQLWYFVQNFLVSTGNISKLLWGARETTSHQRKPLRESLNISDDSILKSRAIRNCFEHFDERIDSWWDSSERKIFIDSNIGSTNMIVGLDPQEFLRNFDTDSMTITFKGDAIEIKPVVDELLKLNKIAHKLSQNPF